MGDDGGPTKTMIEHFNGSTWTVVPSPNPGIGSGAYNELSGITALSTNNVYAIGYYSTSTNAYQTLVEHFNGSKWVVMPSANMANTHDLLNGVTALSANNIYAVGYAFTLDSVGHTLIERFNGTTWSVVSTPSPGTLSVLSGVVALTAKNMYAVGNTFTGTSTNPTLIEHFNGTTWTVMSSPSPGATDNSLAGVNTSRQYRTALGGRKLQWKYAC